jgi:dolichol-phosphate mannosyltransferase
MRSYPSEPNNLKTRRGENLLNRLASHKSKKHIRSIQVLIATLNEQEGIGPTITELKKHLYNASFLVVDGRSTDQTVEIAKRLGAQIIMQDGLGKGDAIAKSIEYIDPNANYIVITDADYTYPAEFVPEMIKLLDENPDVGMVCGNRFTENVDKKALHSVFYFGNRLIAFTHNLLNGVELVDPLTGLRVVRPEILRNWKVQSKGFDIEVELNHYVEQQGFGIIEIPIDYRQRLGKKKLGIRNGGEIFKRMLIELAHETINPLP